MFTYQQRTDHALGRQPGAPVPKGVAMSRTMSRSEVAAMIADRWAVNGQAYATKRDVALHAGSDLARVRKALALLAVDSPAVELSAANRRAFAQGVRAKLAEYRAAGVIA
ncbi:hypothetical protein I5H08_gp024 [Mycobacterium phage Yuna]|uniref:Uncharacterized protein n=1 Tax=Mycobacterium phage Yuna TaxID=2599885 RepID=A0A5J6TF26_9CAUD|nr:hypothetical protein I5H08_gp024 [Mycobacterium phage Yuna]QFG09463.1 hypothetical protein PBI_YUNA_81 [Mycobacterium phage Yuna]